jgi:hypothetical protein
MFHVWNLLLWCDLIGIMHSDGTTMTSFSFGKGVAHIVHRN